MKRNQFIKSCGLVLLTTSSVAALLESCASASYFAKSVQDGNTLIVKKTEFEPPLNSKSLPRTFILVKADNYAFPIAIYKLINDSYSAVLMECTHKSCELKPQQNTLTCPCHGSEFSNTGIVQNPPAENNLKSFTLKTDHETLYIYL